MANLEKYIPFILHFEAGVSKIDVESGRFINEQLFEKARVKGFGNDPDDTGGATMIGVTIGTFTQWCASQGRRKPSVEDLRAISYKDWLAILKSTFWNKWHADEIESQGLAEILVDWAWCSGATGIKRVQRILGVKDDGQPGPITMAALKAQASDKLFFKIFDDRILHAKQILAARPTSKKFWNGWMRRYNSLTHKGFKITLQPIWPR